MERVPSQFLAAIQKEAEVIFDDCHTSVDLVFVARTREAGLREAPSEQPELVFVSKHELQPLSVFLVFAIRRLTLLRK